MSALPVFCEDNAVSVRKSGRRDSGLRLVPTAPSAVTAEQAYDDLSEISSARRMPPRPYVRRVKEERVESVNMLSVLGEGLLRVNPVMVVRGIVAAVVMAVALAGGLFLGSLIASPGATVTVSEGDSLMSIAAGVEDAPSVETAARDIALLNGLEGASLEAGQVLEIPEY